MIETNIENKAKQNESKEEIKMEEISQLDNKIDKN